MTQLSIPHLRFIFFLCLCCGILGYSFQAHAFYKQHGLAMFDDLKYSKGFTHFDYVNPNAPKGGELKLVSIGTYDSVNPYILKGIPAAGLSYLFETLMASSSDETFSQYGLIAESVKVADDRSWIIFYLRPEAEWHDGSPITADDVVFSFHTLMEKGHPFYQAYYKDVTEVKTIDSHSVQFTFKDSSNRELALLVGQMPIISKAYYTAHDFGKTSLDTPIGSGPYVIDNINPGRSITYKRSPDYWGKDLPVNKGKYNFDTIRYDYYHDVTVAIQAFKAREYDLRHENISKVWATSYNNLPALKDGRVIKTEIPHSIPTGMQAFVFNTRRKPFNSPLVREALSYCFDFEWTNKKLFYDAYTRTTSYFSNSIFASGGLPSKEELALLTPLKSSLPSRVFDTEFSLPTTDGSGLTMRPYLREADMLLNKAGWVIKDRKRVSPEGKPMKIEFLLTSSAFERVIAPIIKNLTRLGIESKMRIVDSAQYQKRLDTFDFDITVHVFGQSNSPGNEQINYWDSSKAQIEGSKNYAGIDNPAIDTLVETLVKAQSKDELITATRALDRALLWNFYVIPNWHIQHFRLIYWDKFAQPTLSPPYSFELDSWWIKTKGD